MSLPLVLLVDDSDAILAYGRAALSAHYNVVTAKNGAEALQLARERTPAIVLLDLSMPVMDGDEALQHMKADAALCAVPVVVVSSETARAAACMKAGARAVLEKPVRAEQLRVTVARILDDEAAKRERAGLAVLVVSAGKQLLAVPLDCVSGVHPQVATRRSSTGPEHLREMIDLHGEPVMVLDLAARLAESHTAALLDRMLVVVAVGGDKIALCVDGVRDPVQVPVERLVADGSTADLAGVVLDETGRIPVVRPDALLSRRLIEVVDGARGSP